MFWDWGGGGEDILLERKLLESLGQAELYHIDFVENQLTYLNTFSWPTNSGVIACPLCTNKLGLVHVCIIPLLFVQCLFQVLLCKDNYIMKNKEEGERLQDTRLLFGPHEGGLVCRTTL